MKTILVYGDSNTWGYQAPNSRYEAENQWPNILSSLLGDKVNVVQEGLCGRIAGNHIADGQTYKNGKDHFEAVLRSAWPVEIVIVALGTNDVKQKYRLDAKTIVDDLLWYSKKTNEVYAENDLAYNHKKIEVFYLGIANFRITEHFMATEGLAEKVNSLLGKKAENFVLPPELEHISDGLHYSVKDNLAVAEKLSKQLKEILI